MLLADHYAGRSAVGPRVDRRRARGHRGAGLVLGQHRRACRSDEFGLATGLGHDPAVLDAIFTDTRDAAYQIIERKGATYYAVAAGLVRLVQAILRDQHTVLSVSSLIHDYYGISDVYLSLPAVVGGAGIERIVPLALDEEARGLRRSADVLRSTIDVLGLDETAR